MSRSENVLPTCHMHSHYWSIEDTLIAHAGRRMGDKIAILNVIHVILWSNVTWIPHSQYYSKDMSHTICIDVYLPAVRLSLHYRIVADSCHPFTQESLKNLPARRVCDTF